MSLNCTAASGIGQVYFLELGSRVYTVPSTSLFNTLLCRCSWFNRLKSVQRVPLNISSLRLSPKIKESNSPSSGSLIDTSLFILFLRKSRSEERRVVKEC